MKKVRTYYGVWVDQGWTLFESLTQAIMSIGDAAEVYEIKPVKLGKFRLTVTPVKRGRPKKAVAAKPAKRKKGKKK